MRILVVGGGGREHALTWKIAQSPLVTKIYAAPGNPGIAQLAECVPIAPADIHRLADFAEREGIDLTVVGPEAPLIAGIADVFEGRGLRVFGPSADPARIEGSKVFAKRLMQASGIPTAAFWVCESLDVAQARVQDYFAAREPDARLVVKADGLAAGKGVLICRGEAEALAALEQVMARRIFGASGDQVVLEEFLTGEEASIMAITDGSVVLPLLPSQDHKRAGDGDIGLNTGGMGAYSPVPSLSSELLDTIVARIVRPAVQEIRKFGIPYRGVLYAGIILTADGPKCIEFNCRLGDPETQAVLPLLEDDLVPLLTRTLDDALEGTVLRWKPGASVCVVAASGGYPGDFARDLPITGLDDAASDPACLVFHSGTRQDAPGRIVTEGGRVLGVTGLGASVREAAQTAYAGLDKIRFEGMHYRRDIAARAFA